MTTEPHQPHDAAHHHELHAHIEEAHAAHLAHLARLRKLAEHATHAEGHNVGGREIEHAVTHAQQAGHWLKAAAAEVHAHAHTSEHHPHTPAHGAEGAPHQGA